MTNNNAVQLAIEIRNASERLMKLLDQYDNYFPGNIMRNLPVHLLVEEAKKAEAKHRATRELEAHALF